MKIPTYLDNQQPWLCPSWLKSPCSLQLKFRLSKVTKTVKLAVWDSNPHDNAIEELNQHFTNIGFSVNTEIKHQFHFSGFVLAHWYDLIAIKQNQVFIVEVKPKDHWHNQKQYEYAQLLASRIYPKFIYFVYEYQKERLLPKLKPDFDRIITSIQSKLLQTEKPQAVSSPQCVFCPYAQCRTHPRHNDQN